MSDEHFGGNVLARRAFIAGFICLVITVFFGKYSLQGGNYFCDDSGFYCINRIVFIFASSVIFWMAGVYSLYLGVVALKKRIFLPASIPYPFKARRREGWYARVAGMAFIVLGVTLLVTPPIMFFIEVKAANTIHMYQKEAQELKASIAQTNAELYRVKKAIKERDDKLKRDPKTEIEK